MHSKIYCIQNTKGLCHDDQMRPEKNLHSAVNRLRHPTPPTPYRESKARGQRPSTAQFYASSLWRCVGGGQVGALALLRLQKKKRAPATLGGGVPFESRSRHFSSIKYSRPSTPREKKQKNGGKLPHSCKCGSTSGEGLLTPVDHRLFTQNVTKCVFRLV